MKGDEHAATTDYDELLNRIRSPGLEVKQTGFVDGEGRSIYFYDHDDHLFELHTGTLDERLNRYARGR
jgi:fosfomycin resistance protein FosX